MHEMASVQKANGHDHFLEMKNSAYLYPYNLASNKVNAICIIVLVQSTITSSPVEWAIIIVIYASSSLKRQ